MIFCPALDHRSGKCYNTTEKPVYIDGCTTNVSASEDINMKYWYCNYNINCTDSYIVQPAGFGTTTNLVTLAQKQNFIWKDNICIYKLVLPKAASNNDTISFRVNVMDRA